MKHISLLGLIFVALFTFTPGSQGQAASTTQKKTIKKATMSRTSASSGQEMYMSYCAACHGKAGKGDGPAASALKEPPPDLSTLAENNGGKYPADHVAAVLRFGVEAPAHGSKDMPIWGDLFAALHGGHTSAQVSLRIANLNDYIKTLQTK
jgi:mono/diheme cytochrome c family protein